jgi:cysteine synthase
MGVSWALEQTMHEGKPIQLPPREVYDLRSQLPPPRTVPIMLAAVPDHWHGFCTEYNIRPVQITAYENPVENQKVEPACNIFRRGVERGDHIGKKKIIDSSSGNYVFALKWVLDQIRARWKDFPIEAVVAVIPHSTPKEKRQMLEAAGIELEYADNSLAAMDRAADLAERHGYWYTRQYWNLDNTEAWEAFANSIADQIPDLGALSCGVGTGGSCSGIMKVLTERFAYRLLPNRFFRIAVEVEEDEIDGVPHAVDGVRGRKALRPGTLPWRQIVDTIRIVGEDRSRICSSGLWRQEWYEPGSNCIGGYSTGFAFEGLMLGLLEMVEKGLIGELLDRNGILWAAFLAPDTRKPYRTKYARHGIHFQ